MPDKQFNNVVLPEPDGPMIAVVVAGVKSRSIPLRISAPDLNR